MFKLLEKPEPTAENPFPFEYKGGGYYRHKGVPVGEKAYSLHGQEAVDYVLEHLSASQQQVKHLQGLIRKIVAEGGVSGIPINIWPEVQNIVKEKP